MVDKSFRKGGKKRIILGIAFLITVIFVISFIGCKSDTGENDTKITDVLSDTSEKASTGTHYSQIYTVPEEVSLNGKGTKDNPYLISTPEQLNDFAEQVNSGVDTYGKYYALVSDLDIGGSEFTPIGDTSTTTATSFRGVFDGQGHTISNFKINVPSTVLGGRFGLFAVIDGGEVKNIKISSASVNIAAVNAYCGVIAGMVTGGGEIYGCVIEESVTLDGTASVGAVAGRCMNGSVITLCINYAAVNTEVALAGTMLAGGIVGVVGSSGTESEISYCINYGSVKMSLPQGSSATNYGAGGIAGCIGSNGSAKITNCINAGKITGSRAGGITSRINWGGCTISKCYNTGEVMCISGSNYETGTLIGYTGSVNFSGNFSDSYASVSSGYGVCGSSIPTIFYSATFTEVSESDVKLITSVLIKQIADGISNASTPGTTSTAIFNVRLVGVQSKIAEDGSMTIRIISLFDTDKFDSVGFSVTIRSNNSRNKVEHSIAGDFVSDIDTDESKISAASLGGVKFGQAEIFGLSCDGTVIITITPYGLVNDIKTSATTYNVVWYDSGYCGSVKGEELINFTDAYDMGYGCIMAVLDNATEGLFYAAADLLVSEGYEVVFQSELNGNLYMTAVGTTYSTSLAYTEYITTDISKRELRIMREPVGNTDASLFLKKESEKVCEPLFMQVGAVTYSDSITNGTCYIYRLSDGSFIIYDGANYEDYIVVGGKKVYRQAAQRIYKMLKDYAPDSSNIIIAAWFMTHYHGDHYGALVRFTELYGKDKTIKIERFISNFTDIGAQFDRSIALFPSAGHIQVHPGQTLHIRDAEIEILYTHELYSPKQISNLNTASIISRVNLGGQTILMTGDMSLEANNMVRVLYGDYLKAEFVSVAHHGWDGGSTEFYSLVKPIYAVWPVGLNGFYGINSEYVTKASLSADPRNAYFSYDSTDTINKSESGECVWISYSAVHVAENRMKAMYVAGFSTWVFSLPFNGTNFTVAENTYIG